MSLAGTRLVGGYSGSARRGLRLSGIRKPRWVIGAQPFAFSHLAPDVGLFALCICLHALPLVFGTPQSLTFTVGSGALALVRARLSLVCYLFALGCDSVPLLSDSISLVCEPLAPGKLGLPTHQLFLASIKFGRPPIEFLCPAGFVSFVSPHDSPVRSLPSPQPFVLPALVPTQSRRSRVPLRCG